MLGYKDLYVDQYGNKFFAETVKELRGKIGGGNSRVEKMYRDIAGVTYHVGYCIGGHWLTKYSVAAKKS